MELTEDQIIEKHAENCGYCVQINLLPNANECSSDSCGYSVTKQKQELSKIQRQ